MSVNAAAAIIGDVESDAEFVKKVREFQARLKKLNVCIIERNVGKKIKENATDIVRIDDIRLVELVELMFYTFWYTTIGFFVGFAINRFFPYRGLDTSSTILFFEMTLQLMIVSVGVFYVKKFVDAIPSPFSKLYTYCPYVNTQAISAVVLGIVILNTQTTLGIKFRILGERWTDQTAPLIDKLIS